MPILMNSRLIRKILPMQNMIKRPDNDYDPAWKLFNEQNPGLLRSVGAESTGDEDAGGDDDDNNNKGSGGDDKGGEDDGKDKGAADSGDTSWRDGMDEDVAKSASRFTSPADLAKSYHELQTAFSGRVEIPGKDASEEQVTAYRKTIGVPAEATGYTYDKPEGMEDATFKGEGNQAIMTAVSERAHALGYTPTQTQGIMDLYWSMEADGQKLVAENDQKAIDESETRLRKDWGKDYEHNVRFGEALLEKQGASDLKQLELKDGSLLGSHPDFIRFNSTVGRRIGEGTLQVGLTGTEAGVDLQKESTRLAEAVHDANARGDSEAAERLSKERRAVNEKLHGLDAA